MRSRWVLVERECAYCDYDLRGHHEGTVHCPECGRLQSVEGAWLLNAPWWRWCWPKTEVWEQPTLRQLRVWPITLRRLAIPTVLLVALFLLWCSIVVKTTYADGTVISEPVADFRLVFSCGSSGRGGPVRQDYTLQWPAFNDWNITVALGSVMPFVAQIILLSVVIFAASAIGRGFIPVSRNITASIRVCFLCLPVVTIVVWILVIIMGLGLIGSVTDWQDTPTIPAFYVLMLVLSSIWTSLVTGRLLLSQAVDWLRRIMFTLLFLVWIAAHVGFLILWREM